MSCHSLCSVHCSTGPGGTELLLETLETSYPALLSSTTIPSDVQISTIGDVIRAVEAQIDSKSHEVERLKAAITNLHRQRAELHDFANIHRGMISVMRLMRRLSSELLTEIFLQYVLMETRFRGPWIIATVCSRWRAVALSSSSLWCYFLDIRRRTPAALLSEQLKRSRNAPIYLTLQSNFFHTRAESRNALALLLAASTRWREVTLDLTSKNMSHLAAFPDTFPLLRSLTIWGRERGKRLAGCAVCDLELHCHGIPAQITFPFSSLRKCVVHDCNSTDALGILSLLAPGAAFSVCRCRAPTNPDAVLQPTMSHIHSLHFNGCNPLFIQNVLSALVAPDLTDLTISGYCGIELAPYIIQLLSSAHCPLTRLGLSDSRISADDLRRVLELAPGVVELEIQMCRKSRAALLEVLAATGEARAAPLLRRLVLHGKKLRGRASIMCMLRSRVGVLESVVLKLLLPNEDVEELRAHGMQVNCIQEVHQKAKGH
ncbi:hypothetical protein C8J57DRAFT_1370672 [Mycena rebaudengoi]|nr:hypothetical protein C8J57DRAFT_1370672 [Mycena rebaudengoi]